MGHIGKKTAFGHIRRNGIIFRLLSKTHMLLHHLAHINNQRANRKNTHAIPAGFSQISHLYDIGSGNIN